MSKRKITMTVDEKIFAAFKQLCQSNAMKVSSKVELMMREFLENTEGTKPPIKRDKHDDGGEK